MNQIHQRPKFARLLTRNGGALLNVIVLIAVVGMLIGLLLPVTRSTRGAARRMSCSNNFKQVGLALHNYHSAYKQLPSAMGGRRLCDDPEDQLGTRDHSGRLSGIVWLLPFMEQQALWEQIANPSTFGDARFPAMGPDPWDGSYPPWISDVHVLQCPSVPLVSDGIGLTSYAMSVGDQATDIHSSGLKRGTFAVSDSAKFRHVLDGLSNTIAMGEIANSDDRSVIGQYAIEQPETFLDNVSRCAAITDPERPNLFLSEITLNDVGRGGRWTDGSAGYSMINTILPPNSVSLAIDGDEVADGLYSVSSFHLGGAHVLMADGAVKFITDSIDCGDLDQPIAPLYQTLNSQDGVAENLSPERPERLTRAVSQFGLWGSLGSRSGRETIEQEL